DDRARLSNQRRLAYLLHAAAARSPFPRVRPHFRHCTQRQFRHNPWCTLPDRSLSILRSMLQAPRANSACPGRCVADNIPPRMWKRVGTEYEELTVIFVVTV